MKKKELDFETMVRMDAQTFDIAHCFRTALREKSKNSLNYALVLLEQKLTKLLSKDEVRTFSVCLFFQVFMLSLEEPEIHLRMDYYLGILQAILRQPNISFNSLTTFYKDMLMEGITYSSARSSESDNADDTLERLKEYIYTHLDGDLSLQHLSEYINYNPSYLSRLFRKKNGYNLYDYIERIRIEKAKELLLTTNQPIKDIGAMVGYITPRYFSSFFRRYTDMSPSEFRQKYKGKNLEKRRSEL